jgi:hypothetical protein
VSRFYIQPWERSLYPLIARAFWGAESLVATSDGDLVMLDYDGMP